MNRNRVIAILIFYNFPDTFWVHQSNKYLFVLSSKTNWQRIVTKCQITDATSSSTTSVEPPIGRSLLSSTNIFWRNKLLRTLVRTFITVYNNTVSSLKGPIGHDQILYKIWFKNYIPATSSRSWKSGRTPSPLLRPCTDRPCQPRWPSSDKFTNSIEQFNCIFIQ